MIVAYTRTSTLDQVAGFEAQSKELSAAGCEKIFREQVSSATVRLQLQSALKFVRNGDVFVVTKLDRLARSVAAANHPLRTELRSTWCFTKQLTVVICPKSQSMWR